MNRASRTTVTGVSLLALPLSMLALAPAAQAADVTIRGNSSAETGEFGEGGRDVILDRSLAGGSWQFLTDGIEMSAPTPADRSGVYWASAAGDDIPTSVSIDWDGTGKGEADEFADPAVVIFFDADGDGPEPRVALLHEEIYGANDVYLAGDSELARQAAPSDEGGSGSLYRGPIDQWAENLSEVAPALEVRAVGVNLSDEGEDVGGSQGVVSSVSLGDDVYTFTNQDEVLPTADVNGSVTAVNRTNTTIKLRFEAREQPADTSIGEELRWRVAVDKRTALNFSQDFGDVDTFQRVFMRGTGAHEVKVFKNGVQVRRFVIRTNR